MYSIQCLTTWLSKWVQQNWKTSKNQDVIHRDLIESTHANLKKFASFCFTHVKAHTNDTDDLSIQNSIVDKLATEVLNPAVKVVSNKESPIPNCPLQLLGPPVPEKELLEWVYANMDKLDKSALDSALLTAFGKTVKNKGFEIHKQRLHRNSMYRLTSTDLIVEKVNVLKDKDGDSDE